MRDKLLWAVQNADGLLSVVLAGAVGILGLAGTISTEALRNAIALTLAVLAFSMLRDRWRDERQDAVPERLSGLDGRLDDIHKTLEETSGVAIVTGDGISRALEEARNDTERWFFKGATGTYVRAVTLPHCVEAARRLQRKLDVRLEILDPTDWEVCDRYAGLYRTLANGSGRDQTDWSADGTRRELFATILAACWHQHRYGLLDIRIGLTSAITTFRWDLSSTSLVITQQGPQFPGMVVRKDRSHFTCWSTELDQSLGQARPVPLADVRQLPLSVHPQPDEVRALFRGLGLALPGDYTDEDLHDLARKATNEPDPYLRAA